MADNDPLSDILTLVAAPLAGTIKSVEQFRRGVDEFLRGVDNFNRTMENLNETAERINVMLSEVEEPLRAAVPQVTRTIQAADEVMAVMAGPAKAVAPGLTRLAEVLENPAFSQMPAQMSQVNDLLGEMASRLAPLGQLAESAGGLFGGFRLPGFPSGSSAAAAKRPGDASDGTPAPAAPSPTDTAPTKKTPVKKTPAAKKKTAAKKTVAKQQMAKKRVSSAKTTAANRSSTRRTD
ncbi:MAG: hypothetical protein AAGG08_11990 [Actinomycetota bacterium]